IVIRESYTGESDRIITVLTRDAGVIRSFAKGARGIKSSTLSSTRLLAYSSFIFHKSEKGIFTVKSAVGREMFYPLREDITKLALSQYFAQLVYEFSPDETESEQALRLILNSIYFLIGEKRPQQLIKSILELKMVSMAGYMPAVDTCSRCGAAYTQKPLYFSAAHGECFCKEHLPPAKAVPLPPGVIGAMNHIFYSDMEKLFALNVSGNTLEILSEVSEDYLLKNTGRKFSALDFYKSVTI
ncbi:MAG: DNA repair protein RecO, partial [Clostridia bacterium]|nr:DNA repair protein RecO [Clostridia bacterium]